MARRGTVARRVALWRIVAVAVLVAMAILGPVALAAVAGPWRLTVLLLRAVSRGSSRFAQREARSSGSY